METVANLEFLEAVTNPDRRPSSLSPAGPSARPALLQGGVFLEVAVSCDSELQTRMHLLLLEEARFPKCKSSLVNLPRNGCLPLCSPRLKDGPSGHKTYEVSGG